MIFTYEICGEEAHRCDADCKMHELVLYTDQVRVFVDDMHGWRVFFDTKYALGKLELKRMYMCADYGRVHICDTNACDAPKRVDTGNYVCVLTNLASGILLTGDWQSEKPMEEWDDVETQQFYNASIELVHQKFVGSKKRTRTDMMDYEMIEVKHDLRPYRMSYGQVVLRYKQILCLLLYSDERAKLDKKKHEAVMRDIMKESKRYCAARRERKRQIDMQGVRRVQMSKNALKEDFPIVPLPLRTVDKILNDYVFLIVKFMMNIMTLSLEPQKTPNLFAADYVFFAALL